MTQSRFLSFALLSFGLASLGCSSGSQTPAEISGKLSYKGQPIKAGSMKFVTADGTGYNAVINTDGTYSAFGIPAGDMTITVETESANPDRRNSAAAKAREQRMGTQQKPPAGAGPSPGDNYMKIPEKYASAETSDLKYTVESGSQTKDFDLTD